VIDVSASQGHVVPTVIADHGVFYVSNLGRFDPTNFTRRSVPDHSDGQSGCGYGLEQGAGRGF
jgi:hypothetical protein